MITDRRLDRAFWPLVAAVFLAALALRVPTFLEPWVGSHNAWGGAFYGNVARNFVRYGYLQTEFAPVVSTGLVDPSQFEVYYHHPVLSMWLTGLSFHAFGIHEWSARLAPLVFGLLTIALVLAFARSAWGNGAALLSAAFLALLPVDAYYATHLDPYGSMALFFTVLAVDSYRRWVTTGASRWFTLCAISIVLGCLTSWFTYLVLPGIGLHWFFTQRRGATRTSWLRIVALPALSVLVFTFFIVHRKIALSSGRPEVFDPLGERLLMRTVNLPFERGEIVTRYLRDIWELYTLPVLLLIGAWVALFLRDAVRRRLTTADWCVLILLSFGLLYALAFPGHLPSHDYFVRAYAPGVALATAVVVLRMAGGIARPMPRALAVGAVIAVVTLFTAARTRSLYAGDNRQHGETLRAHAAAIARASAPTDVLLIPSAEDRILAYYLDRQIVFNVSTPERMATAIAETKQPFLVTVSERNAPRFPELLAWLRERFTESSGGGMLIFRPADKPLATP